jgi:large subunit ribosomal protein L15
MKLHELRPPAGSNTARTRVGRGIAAGKGKTAGRGTKGQKARAGGSIPPWFEGGQTPLHQRIPKLRGFKNRFKVVYEVVNVGAIAQRVEAGAFADVEGATKAGTKAAAGPKKGEQLTINADVLRAVGLVRDVKKPLKVLGGGELSTALFVVADAFTKSATQKIEAAGGAVSVLEVPAEARPALGVGQVSARPPREPRTAAGRAAADRKVDARASRAADAAELEAEAAASSAAKATRAPKASKADKAAAAADAQSADGSIAEATADAADADATADGSDIEPTAGDSPLEAGDSNDSSTRDSSTDDSSTDEAPTSATESSTEADTDSEAAGDESA